MKKIFVLIILINVVFAGFCQNSYPEFIDNQNRAAFDFYSKNLNKANNQVFSPFFVNTNFSMLYLATGGGTARQVADFSFFSHDKNAHYNNMQQLQKVITQNNSLNTNFKYSINLFIEDSLKVLEKYQQTIEPYLCDTATNINFSNPPEIIAATINKIIENNTNNYVEGYLKAEDIPQKPNILLNSTAYFSGFWAIDFTNFTKGIFKLDSLGRTAENLQYLTAFDYFIYSETDDYQIIELPYEGFEFSLIIILPKEIRSLQTFEKLFNYDAYKIWRQNTLMKQKVRLIIPEFQINSFYSIKNEIDTIIPAIFTPGGNFLNLIKKIVFVNGIYHYCDFSVKKEDNNLSEIYNINYDQEKQTNNSQIFNANHPFIFLVTNIKTQA
ncbi:MAG: serpin family protein, partial [Bacteroidales bacterium]|nr:serpin family protein [Bacteroidales bacterium]